MYINTYISKSLYIQSCINNYYIINIIYKIKIYIYINSIIINIIMYLIYIYIIKVLVYEYYVHYINNALLYCVVACQQCHY